MKIFYFGGQKSGKSILAEKKTLELAKQTDKKPYYIATYDNSYDDFEMQKRIARHQKDRGNKFINREIPKEVHEILKPNETYIIDCVTMWILNHIDWQEDKLIEELHKILAFDADMVFVLNDINTGVLPHDQESRKFVDLSGIVGRHLAEQCDEVYRVEYGIETRIK
jgi:adenosylcobinamide kinase/adenosylcobinamide-phosphate guanylyltransferase